MHPMLNIAVRAARRAGSIINRASLDGGALNVRSKRVNDFVTQVDQAAEEAIIEIVRKAHPDHGFLAEESGKTPGEAEYVWIIDPLDGTTNFIHGFPQYCGKPWMKLVVPSSGSMIQTYSASPGVLPDSSASKPWSGCALDRKSVV